MGTLKWMGTGRRSKSVDKSAGDNVRALQDAAAADVRARLVGSCRTFVPPRCHLRVFNPRRRPDAVECPLILVLVVGGGCVGCTCVYIYACARACVWVGGWVWVCVGVCR